MSQELKKDRLDKSIVSSRLQQLKQALTETDQKRISVVLRLVDDQSSHASVKAIHDELWKGQENPQTRNKALTRLLARVDEAAQTTKIDLRTAITEARSGGAEQRFVWFEGDMVQAVVDEQRSAGEHAAVTAHGASIEHTEPKLAVQRRNDGLLEVRLFAIASEQDEPKARELMQRLAAALSDSDEFAVTCALDASRQLSIVRPSRDSVLPALHSADIGLLLGLDAMFDASLPELKHWISGHGDGVPGKRVIPVALQKADSRRLLERAPDDWLSNVPFRDAEGKAYADRAAGRQDAWVAALHQRVLTLLRQWLVESHASSAAGQHARERAEDRAREHVIAYGSELGMLDTLQPPRAPAKVDVLEYLVQWLRGPSSPSLFALLGEYGMGKTVTCGRLVSRLKELRDAGEVTLPQALYFDLRDVSGLKTRNNRPKLRTIIEECLIRQQNDGALWGVPADELLKRAHSANLLFIFDGLDEALVQLDEADGQTFTRELLRLSPSAGKLAPRVLISCRTHFFRTLAAQRAHFTAHDRGQVTASDYRAMVLLPFEQAQVLEYLSRALPQHNAAQALELVKKFRGLQELSGRPYTLRLLVELSLSRLLAVRKESGPLLTVDLYGAIVERWLARDLGKHHMRPEQKIRLMTHLAAVMWRRGERTIPVSELEPEFHGWLAAQPDLKLRYGELGADKLDEDLRVATFLVRDDPPGERAQRRAADGSFRFAHTSFHEYFLALHLFEAVRADRVHDWLDLSNVSYETLSFFAELLVHAEDPTLLQTLRRWVTSSELNAELLFSYNLAAAEHSWLTLNLSGLQLQSVSFRDRSMRGESRAPLNLSGCRFRGCDLRGVRLEHVNLRGASFEDCNLRDCSFVDVDLDQALLDGVLLDRAAWQNVRAQNAKLGIESCSGAAFRDCSFVGAAWSLREAPRRAHFIRVEGVLPDAADGGLVVLPDTASVREPHTRRLISTLGHTGPSHCVCFSPDAKHLVSGGADGTLKYWESASGALLGTWLGHHAGVIACAFSNDGKLVLSASSDHTLKLWSSASGLCLGTFHGHSEPVTDCDFSPDAAQIVSASYDGTIKLWETETQKCLDSWDAGGTVHACAFSPDGSYVVSAARKSEETSPASEPESVIKLWDIRSSACRATWDFQQSVFDCAFSPDGSSLFLADGDQISVWDVQGGRCLDRWPQQRSIHSCVVSADGTYVVSCSFDGTIKLWDAKTGQSDAALTERWKKAGSKQPQSMWTAETGERTLYACDVSQDGKRIAAAGASGTVQLLSAVNGERVFKLQSHRSGLDAGCAFSSDDKQLVASFGETIAIWDVETGACRKLWSVGRGKEVSACVFSPDDRLVLTAGEHGAIDSWDAQTARLQDTWRNQPCSLTRLAFSFTGTHLAAIGRPRTILLWDARTGECVTKLEAQHSMSDCAFSRDGERLLTVSYTRDLTVWDLASGKAVSAWQVAPRHRGLGFLSPDGSSVIVQDPDGTLERWDTHSQKRVASYRGHKASIQACAWSADGKRIVTASADLTIRLWDADTGVSKAIWKSSQPHIAGCAFSRNGLRIACIGPERLTLLDIKAGGVVREHQVVELEHAAWDPNTHEVIEASPGASRFLAWQIVDQRGQLVDVQPLEAFGVSARRNG